MWRRSEWIPEEMMRIHGMVPVDVAVELKLLFLIAGRKK
jgi:hypothetical protein